MALSQKILFELESTGMCLHTENMTELPQFLRQDAKEGAAIAEMLATVERTIRLRTGDTIDNLRIVLNDETIVISGKSGTFYQKMLATNAALDVASDREVRNEIDVPSSI